MVSFCGFCGAKASDDRAHFCSDCGGKLEQSVEDPSSPKHTLPLPAVEPPTNQAGVILSKSFVDLIRQEASLGNDISPSASVELSKSFLSSISETIQEDPLLSRDTLQEVPPLQAADIPQREPLVTLPDFLAPMQKLSALKSLTLPVETNPRAPVLKLQKIATPAVASPTVELPRDTLQETPAVHREPPKEEDAPSVLLSTSLEEIILTDQLKEKFKTLSQTAPQAEPKEEPEKAAIPAPAEAFPVIAPKLPFPKLEAPPKSILLAEPASIVSEGFSERLARASVRTLFSTQEVQRALRSKWVQVVLLLISWPLLAHLLPNKLGGFALVEPLFISLFACLLLFRLLAEERQPLWRSMVPLLSSYVLGVVAVRIFPEALRPEALQSMLPSLLSALIVSGSLGLAWMLAPRLRIFALPIDGILLGSFSGAGGAAGLFPVQGNAAGIFLALLFTEILCGGLAGYFWGLALYKPTDQKSFIAAATLGIFLLHSALLMIFALAFSGEGSALGVLLFGLALLAGYLVLFGYAIKLKQLERN